MAASSSVNRVPAIGAIAQRAGANRLAKSVFHATDLPMSLVHSKPAILANSLLDQVGPTTSVQLPLGRALEVTNTRPNLDSLTVAAAIAATPNRGGRSAPAPTCGSAAFPSSLICRIAKPPHGSHHL